MPAKRPAKRAPKRRAKSAPAEVEPLEEEPEEEFDDDERLTTPALLTIPADDMPWEGMSGQVYYPQEGRHVVVRDALSMGLGILVAELQVLSEELDQMDTLSESRQRALSRRLTQGANEMLEQLATNIHSWTLVDWAGNSLPQPNEVDEDGRRVGWRAIRSMPQSALMWLVEAVGGMAEDVEEARGKDSRTSSSPSTVGRRRRRRSGSR